MSQASAKTPVKSSRLEAEIQGRQRGLCKLAQSVAKTNRRA
jgi:hypothetical protein